jgi:hypothetical protein
LLSPWAVRNRLRYGETFFTDSHGGLTTLVGANPNTDGCYSRSLNRMFRDVTGFALLAEPHRDADRAALHMAKTWIAFDPLFTAGLLAGKAERLLVHERALLYWPLFRAGVLPEPDRSFFASHQVAIEAVADYFWLSVLALALFGCGLAYARRQWLALCLLPSAAVLVALYTAIFSEPRYRMPICMLLMPLAALAADWLLETGRSLWHKTAPAAWKREVAIAGGLVVLVFASAPVLAWAGARLREHHRWAIAECGLNGHAQFCAWRTVRGGESLDGRPGVKGTWNGVGVALPEGDPNKPAAITVETKLPLAPGLYTLHAEIDLVRPRSPENENATITFLAGPQALAPPIALAEVPAAAGHQQPLAWKATLRHPGGTLRLHMRIDRPGTPQPAPAGRVWLGDLRLEETQESPSASD